MAAYGIIALLAAVCGWRCVSKGRGWRSVLIWGSASALSVTFLIFLFLSIALMLYAGMDVDPYAFYLIPLALSASIDDLGKVMGFGFGLSVAMAIVTGMAGAVLGFWLKVRFQEEPDS